MKPVRIPFSPSQAPEFDEDDGAARKTRRDQADQRSTNVFDALVRWSIKEENQCYEGITARELRQAEDSASRAYVHFRDRMPEYQDGDSDEGAVHAYTAFRDRLVTLKRQREIKEAANIADKSN